MCNPKNERSWKLLERLHMRREGLLLQNIYFETDRNGAPIWLDTYEYAILKEEWCNGQVHNKTRGQSWCIFPNMDSDFQNPLHYWSERLPYVSASPHTNASS